MGIFHKYQCLPCAVWRRTSGKCPKCGSPFKKREAYSLDYRDVTGRRIIEDTEAKSKRAAEHLLGGKNKEEKKRSAPTFKEVAEDYQKVRSSQKSDKGKRDEYALKRLLPVFGEKKMAEILERDILTYMQEREASAGTVAKEVRTMKSIWRHGRANFAVVNDPFFNVRVKEPKRPIKNLPALADEARIWNALPEEPLPLYQFMAFTGARTSEARLLKKEDLELEKNLAWVKHKTRSGDIEREPVYLDANALQAVKTALSKSPEDSPYVFVNPKTSEPWASPKTTFRRAMKRIGATIKSPHDLRHLFVTRLVEAGVHPDRGMRLSRHKDPRTWMRYEHASTEMLLADLQKARPQGEEAPQGKKKRIRFSPEEMAAAIREKGVAQVARDLEVSYNAVVKFCQRHGIQR
ncbi:MAG: site-specific integrase [Desulfuromonadales bacterium]|nr:site-specific integrase [Desulfuromonadales bacterium]